MENILIVLKSKPFQDRFLELVLLHKSIYSKVKIKAEMFEEILYKSLCKISNNVVWNYNSHMTGVDIVFEGVRISCKSGKITKNKLKYSGSRTTTYKSIKDKVSFLSNNHEDIIVFLAEQNGMYHLYTIPSSFIIFGSPEEWKEDMKKWKRVDGYLSMSINKSMSDQLWVEIDLEKICANPIMSITI